MFCNSFFYCMSVFLWPYVCVYLRYVCVPLTVCVCSFTVCLCSFDCMCVCSFTVCLCSFDHICVFIWPYVCVPLTVCVCLFTVCLCSFDHMCVFIYGMFVFLSQYVCVLCSDQKVKEEVDGIDTENLAVLERLKQSQRDEYLKVGPHSCLETFHMWLCYNSIILILVMNEIISFYATPRKCFV